MNLINNRTRQFNLVLLLILSCSRLFAFSIVKQRDDLYYAQTAPDLFFVLEQRSHHQHSTIWDNQYLTTQNQAYEKFIMLQKQLPSPTLEQAQKIASIRSLLMPIFSEGLAAFATASSFHTRETLAITKEHNTTELWVAYAYASTTAPTTLMTEENLHLVELVFNVYTDMKSPFTSHMGISRSLDYILRAKNILGDQPPTPIHPNISVPLHTFAMAVMLKKDESKSYMITTPVRTMRSILIEKLPADALWIGDTTWQEQVAQFGFPKNFCPDSTSERCTTKVAEIIARGSPISQNMGGPRSHFDVTEIDTAQWAETSSKPFFWSLKNKDLTKELLHLDSSTMLDIKSSFMWFFNNRYFTTNIDQPYIAVDIAKAAARFHSMTSLIE